MTKRIAVLLCWLLVVQSSVVSAQDNRTKRLSPVTVESLDAAAQPGPIRTASLSKHTETMVNGDTGWSRRPVQDVGRDDRPWVERHPVWTGAIVGFAAASALTYLASRGDDDQPSTFIDPDYTGVGYMVWGGLSAGVGALIGWGIGRNRNNVGP